MHRAYGVGPAVSRQGSIVAVAPRSFPCHVASSTAHSTAVGANERFVGAATSVGALLALLWGGCSVITDWEGLTGPRNNAGVCADGGDATSGLATLGTPCCTPGELACAGHAQKLVLVCDPRSKRWSALQSCSGQTLCDTRTGLNQGSCQPIEPICAGSTPGSKVCDGKVLVECGPDLVTSEPTTCTHACDEGRCVGGCTPESRRCNINTPQVCDGTGTWHAEAPCAFVCRESGECDGDCVPDTVRCLDGRPQACDAEGRWVFQDACSVLCVDGACADSCADTTHCDGQLVQTCAEDGVSWTDVEECSYVCLQGECVGRCWPGSARCSEQVPEMCSAHGEWQKGEACPHVCADGRCIGVCTPRQRDCRGLVPRLCSDAGQWTEGGPCAYVCSAGICGGGCSPGEKRCDGSVPQTCDESGAWQSGSTCAENCTAGECTGACTPGTEQCNGLVPQTCDANGRWVDNAPCTYACSNGACHGDCVPTTVDCLGQTPQTCDSSGAWQPGPACVDQACVEGACVGVCAPGAKTCVGTTLKTCQPNGQWDTGTVCGDTTPVCSGSGCVSQPSCANLDANCGKEGTLDCCELEAVPGGTFPMGRGSSDACAECTGTADQPEHSVTVAAFSLERFEVTVGRFRRFVEQYDGTPPLPGAGMHLMIPDSGWRSVWDEKLPLTQAALMSALREREDNQRFCVSRGTWRDIASVTETLPINCVTWYEAFAFCAWDGGRLPTEAEWEFVAAGGTENRLYPWGTEAPDTSRAAYLCLLHGTSDCSFEDLTPVGTLTAGAGRWGHRDLAGNVWEWALDRYSPSWYTSAGNQCVNCANLVEGGWERVVRGGAYSTTVKTLRSAARSYGGTTYRGAEVGFRCARQ